MSSYAINAIVFITMPLVIALVNVHVYTMKELKCGIESMHSILKFICI